MFSASHPYIRGGLLRSKGEGRKGVKAEGRRKRGRKRRESSEEERKLGSLEG
jgi:hypothetical protein